LSNQGQAPSILPIHNTLTSFDDQTPIYDHDPTYDQEGHDDPLSQLYAFHGEEFATSPNHDETRASKEHINIEDQTNKLGLSEHHNNQNPNTLSTSTTNSISNPPSCPLHLTTFIYECSSLGTQQPLSTSSPSSSNKELMSSIQITPSPTVHHILQNMNYQGKGLGLHEQGILEPIYVNVPPHSYGLGYTPQGKQCNDVGTSSINSKSTTFHRTSHHITKTYATIPPPSSYKC